MQHGGAALLSRLPIFPTLSQRLSKGCITASQAAIANHENLERLGEELWRLEVALYNAVWPASFLAFRDGVPPDQLWCGRTLAQDLAWTPNILSNYGAILATRQGPDLSPGFINANNGWGSTCNPYGGYGVFTSNASGTATDEAFVVVIP